MTIKKSILCSAKLICLLGVTLISSGFTTFNSLDDSSSFNERSEAALKADFAFKVNLKNNTVIYYENGIPVDSWNVATADITGVYHRGEKQVTPKGIYSVQRMVACPRWSPGSYRSRDTGELLTERSERFEYFSKHPDIFGPCGKKNPLGNYVIWFQQPYGLHGNANKIVMERKNPEHRRVSGGCVRNPNDKIREIFLRIIEKSPSMSNFMARILQQEYSTEKRMIAYEAKHLDIKVVIGEWDNSHNIANNKVHGERLSSSTIKNKSTYCKLKKSSPVNQIYPIESGLAQSIPREISYLKIIERKRGFYQTKFGWIPKEAFFSCKKLESDYLSSN
jgi:hypothetical protein